MKYVKPMTGAAFVLGAVLIPIAGQASGADLSTPTVVQLSAATSFQCSEACAVPGIDRVDPQTVAGPDAADPALRVERRERIAHITCRFDGTGDGTKYRVLVDDQGWAGQWWVAKTSLQSPSPGEIDEHDIPPCPDFF
jgi:hypothetical protein